MAVAEYLDPQPGEIILDLSAAPGGKSTQISAKLQGQGILWSNEIHPGRARTLTSNLERWGSPQTIITNENPDRLSRRLPDFFDRILVDAPCSGEGMFRKEPDAAKEWSPEHVISCAHRQKMILNSAADMLKPGGRLVYSTCTFAPEENEQVVWDFLQHHPDFFPLNIPSLDPSFVSCPELPGAVRLYPHRLPGEGHFIAVLERTKNRQALSTQIYDIGEQKGKSTSASHLHSDQLKIFQQFSRSNLSLSFPEDTFRYLLFGDHLYRSPLPHLSLDGLSILRPGLYLGMIKPGRFQPGPGLSQVLKPEQCREYLSFNRASSELSRYLRGESWFSAGSDGWILVGIDRFPLGWAKRTKGEIKNHYPKELRPR